MPLIPMRDRLVLKPVDVSRTKHGLHIVTSDEGKNPFQKDMSTMRCVVVAQGDGMLVGETGQTFENPFPTVIEGKVERAELLGRTVVVSKWAGFEDENPDTGEKLLIVTPLDVLAVVEDS